MRTRCCRVLVAGTVIVLVMPSALASDCEQTSVGFVPLNDLGSGLYLDEFEGGLYPNGSNMPPLPHFIEGVIRAGALMPLDPQGEFSETGSIVLLSIGMSNTTQEFCSQGGGEPCTPWSFMGQASTHPLVDDTHLAIANGALSGQSAATWDEPADENYDRVRDDVLAPMGLSEAQVQVVWVKQANEMPAVSLPAPEADAWQLVARLADIARSIGVRYPNARIIFLSSRIYAGYACSPLNPEPYAYESGFAVKWLIEAQIQQMMTGRIDERAGDLDYTSVAPWLAWGPYMWADGLVPRSDGLIWKCSDFEIDGTHPGTAAEEKAGHMLLDFFLHSPFARPWFTDNPADLNDDGIVSFTDMLILLSSWGPCPPPPEACEADIDENGFVGLGDLLILLSSWG